MSTGRVIVRSILLNQATLGPASSLASGISPGSGIVNLTPYIDFSWADSLTYILTVTAVTGSPTGGTLTAAFQLGNPHLGDGANQTINYPFSDPSYVALDSTQKTALIADGEDWPSPVASYNSTFPVTVQRTIKNFGAMVNLQLNASTLAGGTSPKFTLSAVLIQKGTYMSQVGMQAAVTANVAASGSSTELFPATGNEQWANGRAVFNDSTAVLYLKYGTAASSTSYTVQVAAGGYYEFPQPVYSGEVDGAWSSATGAARLTSW